MSTQPSSKADDILNAALGRDPAAREGFIIKVCGEDAALLAEVRALLVAHEAAPADFLASPAAAVTSMSR